jgi:hypothetical protein
MEHPLINDIDNMTLEELQSRITDLTKKLSWAARTNQHLASQIRMALETFQTKYREKQEAMYNAANKGGPNYSDKIDIS